MLDTDLSTFRGQLPFGVKSGVDLLSGLIRGQLPFWVESGVYILSGPIRVLYLQSGPILGCGLYSGPEYWPGFVGVGSLGR
jgi:hypothetical protein